MPTCSHSLPAPKPVFGWQPAIAQLRDLPHAQLDPLVSDWLASLDLTSVRLVDRRGGQASYQALVGRHPCSFPVHFRLYQRKNRLQPHHIEAFLGYLVRNGISAGVLITTGGYSRAAVRIGNSIHSPRIRLLSGKEWAQELASRRIGLRSRRLSGWFVDLAATMSKEFDLWMRRWPPCRHPVISLGFP